MMTSDTLPPRNGESILVVDDDPQALSTSAELLEREGFQVARARSGGDAAELIERQKFDLIITDIVMPGMTGFEVIQLAQKLHPDVLCIAMTGYGSLDSAMDALRLGAYSYMVKPYDVHDFKHCVYRALEKQRLTKELRLRNEALERLNRELDAKVQEATRELRDLNQLVLTQMAGLQEVDRLKSAFLDNVSHDLRSPLTTIEGYLSLMLENSFGVLSDQATACMRSAQRAAAHMEYLVDQLLEATQLTSGKVQLNREPVRVVEILEEAAAMARGQVDAKGLRLELRKPADGGLTLRADRGRLLQIFNNLIGNACKFTPKGGRISLAAWPEGMMVHFCVEDTGSGIAPEHHARIFEKFYQVNPGPTRTFKGLGLGLRIVRDLVELHGGKIWVESEAGRGSKFHWTFPQ
ncbi:MAG: response regulator [Elusimicrobia bacterium]|nr:response regulator [Elusimicrobiota bacterium]